MWTLIILAMLWSEGAAGCEPDSGNCRGNCEGFNIDGSADPGPGGNNVDWSIHICNTMTMSCTSANGSYPATSSHRAQAETAGCTVTISPVQGTSWGAICSCEDLAVHCDGDD